MGFAALYPTCKVLARHRTFRAVSVGWVERRAKPIIPRAVRTP
jgi:hypothetical protein